MNTKWIKKILGLNGHEEINFVKESLFNEKKRAIEDLKRINKRFKLIIDANDIELVIRDMEDIRQGK